MTKDQINKNYQKLLITVSKIEDMLKRNEIEYKLSFYNGHYYKDGEVYRYEYYPIPVIEAASRFDILVDFDSISIDAVLKDGTSLVLKEQSYNFEIYDPNDYLDTICTSKNTKAEINDALKSAKRKNLKISFEIEGADIDSIENIINYLK